jgi:VWFA-related protein
MASSKFLEGESMRLQTVGTVATLLSLAAGLACAQDATPSDPAVIRAETKLVLVDAVVTDKKGGYVHGLMAKNFKIWEDNKEQNIKNFSFEADPASPSSSQPRYLVLFFDNSTMNFGDQARAREAAGQFIDANAAPNRLMAIVNYGGAIQIPQNFTADAARLRAAVSGISVPSIQVNEQSIGPRLTAAGSFGARDVILALRTMAKNLSGVPGRKSLILLTGGFPLRDPELISEVTATIEACNRANVAIYPIDVRGLVAPGGGEDDASLLSSPNRAAGSPAYARQAAVSTQTPGPVFALASFTPGMAFFAPQAPGGGRGGSGGGGGGGAGGGRGPVGGGGGVGRGGGAPAPSRGTNGVSGTPAPVAPMGTIPPYNRTRTLLPKFPETAATNQDIMHVLAEGTGGFVLINTNDLLSGFEKIGKELNEYYLIGYTPPDSAEGSCHTLKVKVEHSGENVRARTGYCNAKSRDLLAKNPVEKTLENRAAVAQAGDVDAAMTLPFFFTGPNQARVDVAMDIAPKAMKFEKVKGKEHGELNILGIAYATDGSVAARFSDTVKLDLDGKKEVEEFSKKPYHYENQFDIVPGQYRLKVVFSSGGDSFGKVEKLLAVDAYDGQKFSMSSVVISTNYRPAASMGSDLDALLIEDRTPLVAEGMQVMPGASNRFKNTDKPAMYVEIYEPLLTTAERPKDLAVAIQVRILDAKSGEQKGDSGLFRIAIPDKNGSPKVTSGTVLPIASLTPGSYRVIFSAVDSAGNKSQRWSDFEVQ